MFDWNDLRFFLETARAGNTTRAAKKMRVNQSTVSRRIQALEEALQCNLFIRSHGGLQLGSDGERLMTMALEAERTMAGINRAFTQSGDHITGKVRVATVEEIATGLIVPHMGAFRKRWPHIQLQLITGMRILDLARGEADISLRMVRPESGDLFARRVGGFRFAVFTSQAYLDSMDTDRLTQPSSLEWIVLNNTIPNTPEGNFLKERLAGVEPIMRATSTKTVVASVRAGLGVALLPRPYRHIHKDLIPLPIETGDISREIWMVFHKDNRRSAAVTAVLDFLEEVFQQPLQSGFTGE